MYSEWITQRMFLHIVGLWLSISCLSSEVTTGSQSKPEWERHHTSLYLFVLDTSREVDTSHPDAAYACRSHGGRLVSINSEEELQYLQTRIQALVERQGQRFALEQWWTGGTRKGNTWIWQDAPQGTAITMEISAEDYNPRVTFPLSYVGLVHDQDGWKLKLLPENFRLRYICERDVTPELLPMRPAEERLLSSLFREYDVDARGTKRADATLTVSLQLLLKRIETLDMQAMVLSSVGMLIVEWVDERLFWMPSLYENITNLVVKADRVWLPDLNIINGAEDNSLTHFHKGRVLISYEGRVHWEPGGSLYTTCDVDIRFFPFDTQHCPLHIGTWLYPNNRLNLTSYSLEVFEDNYSENNEWDLVGTASHFGEAGLPCCLGTTYPQATFTLTLQRKSAFYVINIVWPCVVLCVLALTTLWVPPEAGEKVSASVSVFLAFTIFLLIVAETLPRTPRQAPLLGVYLMGSLLVVTLCVCCNVVSLNIHHNCKGKPIPKWAKSLLCHRRKRAFCFIPPNYFYKRTGYGTGGSSPCNASFIKEKSEEGQRDESKNSNSPSSLQKAFTHVWENSPHNEDMVSHNSESESQKCLEKLRGESHRLIAENEKQWKELAVILDRIFFVIMSVFFLLCFLMVLFLPWVAPQ